MRIGLVRHFRVTEAWPSGWLTSEDLQRWRARYDVAEPIVSPIDVSPIAWQRCFSSDLKRARVTARAAYGGRRVGRGEASKNNFKVSPDAVRYQMNAFVIAVGCYVKALTDFAKQTGEKIGPVMADLGNKSCQVPFAPDYIRNVEKRGAIGKKRKSAKC